MTGGGGAAAVSDAELLARFIVFENRVRADGTIKGDAFIPPPDLELSVTRHGDTSEDQLWERGAIVSAAVSRVLVGRADVSCATVRGVRPLNAVPAPLPEDLHHAHVVGWPPSAEKPRQKVLAMSLAAAAKFVRCPETWSPGLST
jgi:hypothetical protein